MPPSFRGSPPKRPTPRGYLLRDQPSTSSAPAPAPSTPPPPPPPPPPEVFRRCENCGKDILATNFTMHELHCARHYKKCQYCGLLLETSALEAHLAEMRSTPAQLALALESGDAKKISNALDHGAKDDLFDWRDERGASMLHLAAAAARDNWALHALVDQMLRMGANVAARDSFGWQPLHAAARGGSAAVIPFLVAAGADVHASGGLGSTPLEVANGEEVRAALLLAGAELPGSQGSSRNTSRGSSSLGSRPHPPSSLPMPTKTSSSSLAADMSRVALSDPSVDPHAPASAALSRPESASGRPSSARRLRAIVHAER